MSRSIRKTNMNKLLVSIVAIAASVTVHADSIDVNSDGSVLISSTRNRVIYEHDAKTLAVIKRTRVDQDIKDLAVNADGTLIFCADGNFGQKISVRDRKTGKILSETNDIAQVGGFSGGEKVFIVSKKANLLAYRTEDGVFSIVNMADGKTTTTIKHDEEATPTHVGCISPDGQTLTLISGGLDTTSEKNADGRISFNADLKAVVTHEKADGKASTVTTYSISSGKLVSTREVFYDAAAHQMAYAFHHKSDLHVVTYGDVNMRLPATGEPELYRTTVMAYGFGVTHDGSRFAVGSMINSGAFFDTGKPKKQTIEGATPNPGFPEYYKTMVFDADDNMYGLTGDLRLFRVDDKNKMYLIKPLM